MCTCSDVYTCTYNKTSSSIASNEREIYEQSTVSECLLNSSNRQNDDHESLSETTISCSLHKLNVYEDSTVLDCVDSSLKLNEYDDDTISMLNAVPINDEHVSPLRAPNHMLNLSLRGKGMHVGHLNVRGIRSKFEQLETMLKSTENDISILGITETKLGSDHPNSAFYVDGYKLFRNDKMDGSGGLIVYVREDIICKRRENLEENDFESLWLEIFPKLRKSFLICFIYRNPNSNVSWNERFEVQMEKALDEQKEVILLGDFNKDLLNPQIKSNWEDYMTSFGLTQKVNVATRVIANRSKTLIDHIYSNQCSNISYIDVPQIGLSDHFPVFLTRKTNVSAPKLSHHSITYRSLKKFNEENFKNDLMCIPWDVIKVFDDVNDALDSWYTLFNEVLDRHVPIKRQRVKRPNQPSWLTPEIIEGMKQRDRLKSLGDEENYRKARNNVTELIRNSKKKHFANMIDNSKQNPGNIWKVFKEFGAGKGNCSSKNNNIFTIKKNGQYLDDSKDIANEFNSFFISIAENLKEPVEPTSHERLEKFCKEKLANDKFFEIPEITVEKVLKYLKGLDTSKSTGVDNIGPRLLRISAPFISESLAYLCNLSFKEGKFPALWKEAKVKPLHKAGDHDDVNNYRPISILPVLSKLIETHVNNSIMSYLECNDLLYVNQSGFRPSHSCETALVSMIENWLKALNNGYLVGVVLIDFRKAFDLVDHDILLDKLKVYQLDCSALSWLKSYLNVRKQSVVVNNVLSDDKVVTCGVPQGSILGPLLFLLFINDLPLYTNNVKTDLYADDTTLYDMSKSKTNLEINLTNAISKLSTWCKRNGMVINFSKTKLMLITSRQKRNQMNDAHLEISLNDTFLQSVTSEKILGVQVDNNLSWSNHVSSLTKKISRNVWLLSQISKYLPTSNRVTFYKSYIQPHIDYCNIVWAGASKTSIARIERLQKRACKVILDYNCDNVLQSMADINIMTVRERIFLRKAKFMYKVSVNSTPSYIQNLFHQRRSDDETLPLLRSTTSGNFILPKPNTELYRNSLSFTGPIVWNCLPGHVKTANSIEVFHKSCIKWMKGECNMP